MLLKAIEDNVFTEKEAKKIVAVSPELLLQTSSIGIEDYDFEQAFPSSLDEKTGRKAIQLPMPELYAQESPADVNMLSGDHEALKEEMTSERKNLHDFLLKSEFRFGKSQI